MAAGGLSDTLHRINIRFGEEPVDTVDDGTAFVFHVCIPFSFIVI